MFQTSDAAGKVWVAVANAFTRSLWDAFATLPLVKIATLTAVYGWRKLSHDEFAALQTDLDVEIPKLNVSTREWLMHDGYATNNLLYHIEDHADGEVTKIILGLPTLENEFSFL